MTKKTVFGIVGPTASGKTALSLALAKRLGAEILCMDSMQVYRGMDIGTAKPTLRERALAPHHLLDIADPREPFSVTEYVKAAEPLLKSVRVPLLVGGTGFYLRGLSQPLTFGYVRGDEEIRRKYEEIGRAEGADVLHRMLADVDPPAAEKLHKNDTRRVIRALEVFELTGRRFSDQRQPDGEEPPFDFRLYALDWDRSELYGRIDRRVDQMLEEGLAEEVRVLLDAGVTENAQAMQGLGYKEMIPVLRGQASPEEAAALIKLRTRHYAKRQLTWFRADKRIRWLKPDAGNAEQLAEYILKTAEE